MKGVVFNLLEEVVVKHLGETAWEDLLDATGLSGSYTSLGSYPDEEMRSLLAAGAKALGKTPNEALRWFGREAMPLLARNYPAFFAEHKRTEPFVLSVNGIIHPEVRKLYAGAHCPHFHVWHARDGALIMIYDSPRKLCALAHGFLEGAGDHFGESVSVEHMSCMLRGDPKCMLSIRIERLGATETNVA
jgi:hypothetical protein